MKKAICFLNLLFIFLLAASAQTPILGTYPATNVATAGKSATVSPSQAPNNAKSIMASVSANFRGIIRVDSISGNVNIINACPSGSYTVSIRAFNGTNVATSSFTLTVGNPLCSQGLLTSSGIIGDSGAYTTRIRVGDFNNDNKQDIAVIKSSQQVSVRLGDGLGGFGAATDIPVTTNLSLVDLVVQDFNGDGNLDFAATATPYNQLQFGGVFFGYGNGLGGFVLASGSNTGLNPNGLATGDFNYDGKLDLIVANLTGNSNAGYSIIRGDGSGGFTTISTITNGVRPYFVFSADFNLDGKDDIGYTHESGFNAVNNAVTTNGVTTTVGISPTMAVTADFNNDGKPDLAVRDSRSNTFTTDRYVSIRLSSGTNQFTIGTELYLGFVIRDMAAGDFNGDGNQDLSLLSANALYILLGNGTGGFSIGSNLPIANNPTSLAVGDFNGDGMQDVAVTASSTLNLWLGKSNEINVQGNGVTIPDGNSNISIADFTNFQSSIVGNTAQRTFTIQNTGLVNLTVNNIRASGSDSAQFLIAGITLPVVIAPGASASFNVKFLPSSPGGKSTSIIISNNDCDEAAYDFVVGGWGSDAQAGMALAFDGVNDEVLVGTGPGNFGTGNFSVQTWFRTSATTANASIATNRTNCGMGNFWHVGMQSGKLVFEISENAVGLNYAKVISTQNYNDGTWHHVSCTRNAGSLSIYVDGSMVAFNTAVIANLNTTSPVKIGGSSCGNFAGLLDETRIWNRGLSACEIQSNYACEITGMANGLIANYHYNQGIADSTNNTAVTLIDSSAGHLDATLNNFELQGNISNWTAPGAVTSGASCNTNMWLGLTNAWATPSNWSTGKVPTASTIVLVNNCAVIMPVVTGTTNTCYKLMVSTGALVTISAGAALNVVGQ